MGRPLVTVLIPARNEEEDLGRSLRAVLEQDLDRSMVEVLVVDGNSTDRTAEVAKALLDGAGFARAEVLTSRDGTTPAVLNRGLDDATGEHLARVDARSIIPPDYVRRTVDLLRADPNLRVVGGSQVALARDGSARSLGIARALNNRWAMGLSRYRRGAPSGPTDTVYLGVFRTEELRAVGGWDGRFATNQDFELNRRMARDGTVWFESDLEVGYLPRRSLRELFQQYRRFGQWKVRYWRLTGDRPRPRQVVLLVAPPAFLLGAVAVALRHRRLLPHLAATGVAVALGMEVTGAERPAAPPEGRLVALGAMSVVTTGWLTGVWSSLLRREPSPSPITSPAGSVSTERLADGSLND